MKRILISLSVLAFFHFPTNLMAQIPRVINYQGMLLGSDEQPVAERDYKITFNLYDESNNLLWSEVHNKVFIGGGMFHVLLGTVNTLNLAFDKPYFLGIQVENDSELQPRMMMTSAAYSFRADDADKVAGISVSTTPQPNTLLPLDGSGKFPSSVLSGGTASGDFLRKNAPDTTRGSSSADMLRIENTGSGRGMTVMSTNSHGIYGKSESNLAGVEGENSGSGPGVRGFSKHDHGAIGYSEASDKAGVYGNNTDGNGVWGNSQNKHGVYGFSNNGRGVKGESAAGGVLGESTQGIGVEGRSNANDGMVGWSNNPDKSGVFGSSPFGNGVTGRSENKDGILGVTTSSNAGHAGVHARNTGAGPAVYSEGDVYVTGKYYGDVGPSQGAPFSRPAFDSGWVEVDPGELGYFSIPFGVDQYLPTNRYNNDNFFVDLMTKDSGFAGNDHVGDEISYSIESNNSILVHIGDADYLAFLTHIRIRVWYIK
ncbi:hypothetical protein GWO43_01000 [candidate division KSB1 bacterium]|nr:hypothetical protein [candidate division KSB1 bacterium]NIV68554.1 hypothetical protein [Phycisphaerae bacterium]NIR69109.1 hypothetical protein [candidate division KSB1 bacterium]NIS22640.1 hypothetical protein [candidate division KSB1 bacterium]NIT69498.1 hypothetical protein [candidate division KSB1 bacterium]